MTTNNEPDQIAIAEVLEAEFERCRAFSEGDWPALEKLLHDDLAYTHMSGVTQDKATYCERSQSQRLVRRSDLKVRLYGNVAVMTGGVIQGNKTLADRVALQVWVNERKGWLLVSSQTVKLTQTNS